MLCPECGHDVPDDAQFCTNCGASLNPADEPVREETEAEAKTEGPPPAAPEPPDSAAPEPAEPSAPDQPESATPAQTPPQSTSPTTPPPSEPPAASTAPTQPPPPSTPSAAPSEPQQPQGQEPGQAPPGQQPPPPTAQGQGPQPPEEKKGTNWGAVCLIGCGILLVLAILGGVLIYFVGRSAVDRLDQLDVPSTVNNRLGVEEPGADSPANDTEAPGASDAETQQPSEQSDSEDGLTDIIGQLGEAIEGAGEAISAGNIKGFDPSTVDPKMLPTFYGFMVALANDDPQAMHRWMGPEYKQEWTPDEWTVAPHIEHLSYEVVEKNTLDDGTVEFIVEEGIRDTNANEESTRTWEIHFEQIDGEWYVTRLR